MFAHNAYLGKKIAGLVGGFCVEEYFVQRKAMASSNARGMAFRGVRLKYASNSLCMDF